MTSSNDEVSRLFSTTPYKKSVSSCSKASRGLFVQLPVGRIFTAIAISPGLPLRQRWGGYTIRAGRQLCDKEFRYHRTVIVTAAVYRGFFCKHYPQVNNTHAINLPALGRFQPVYVLFRVCTDLCFW